ncbi:MAG TPA: hypothetical protein IAB06_00430 [Candidatus Avacidaminococcus intestinavium]|uniref:Uncharacterized protein n=1 Tax=Candidatus Avacidaminococcus intestinavium TaxID=2840684 RepID=A0A9D1MNQ0_9FIRM|nr:hypothetical protein [Candidatus Avacidaminococcus intestinavium]
MEKLTKWFYGLGAASAGALPRAQQGLQNCNGICGSCGGGCIYGVALATSVLALYGYKRFLGLKVCNEK